MVKKDENYVKKSRSDRPVLTPFLGPWGLLKTLTSKKKKNGPKMIQKWFKIAQIA